MLLGREEFLDQLTFQNSELLLVQFLANFADLEGMVSTMHACNTIQVTHLQLCFFMVFTFSRRCFFYIIRMFLSFFVVFPFFQIAEHPKFVPFAPSTDFSDRPAPTPPAGTPSLLGGAVFPAEALQTPQGKLQHTTALRMPLGRMHLVAGLCVLKSLLHMVYILPCTEKVLSSVHSKKYQVLAVI